MTIHNLKSWQELRDVTIAGDPVRLQRIAEETMRVAWAHAVYDELNKIDWVTRPAPEDFDVAATALAEYVTDHVLQVMEAFRAGTLPC